MCSCSLFKQIVVSKAMIKSLEINSFTFVELYEAIMRNLSHEVNNQLQEILFSTERIAAATENKNYLNMNSSIKATTDAIFIIRDLCAAYSNLFDSDLEKHIKYAESINFGRKIEVIGNWSALSTKTIHLLITYIHIIAKTSNVKIKIDNDTIIIGPLKNISNYLPNSRANYGKLISLLASKVSINVEEDLLIIKSVEHNHKESEVRA